MHHMGPLNSHSLVSLVTLLPSLLRRCVQCRNRRPVWAPEANHKQLCVGQLRPSAYRPSIGGARDYSEWAEVGGPWPSSPRDLQYERTHNTVPVSLPRRCSWNTHQHVKAATIPQTLLTRSQQVPAASAHFFLFFTLDDNKREHIKWWSKIWYIDFCEGERLVPWVSYSKHVLMKDVIVAVTKMLQRQQGCWCCWETLRRF